MPLQDRMEIIRLPGYTEYEKYQIAKNFLLAKQVEMNGLADAEVTFSRNAVLTIIRRYTRRSRCPQPGARDCLGVSEDRQGVG